MAILGQVMASTSVDAHGEAIPEDVLRDLFEQMPDPLPLHIGHDQGTKPVSRAYNKRLETFDDGTLVIKCDIDIDDDADLDGFGGLSVGYSSGRYTLYPNRQPHIEIAFNPRLMRTAEVHKLVELSRQDLQIDALHLVQKSLDVPAIIIITFATSAYFGGFFSAAGEDTYVAIKKYLSLWRRRIREEHGADLICQFNFVHVSRGVKTKVIATFPSSELRSIQHRGMTAAQVLACIREQFDVEVLEKASVVWDANSRTWRIVHVVDRSGNIRDGK